MPNINKVIIAGHLTKDIELAYSAKGTAVGKGCIATNYNYGDVKEVYFADFTAFGKRAETLADFTKKGDPLMIEGRMKTDVWEGDDGKKRYKTYIMLDNFHFLGTKKDSSGSKTDTKQEQLDLNEEEIPF